MNLIETIILQNKDKAKENLENQRRYQLIKDQVSLWEISYSDHEAGLDTHTTIVCIANIIETGHPAGLQDE